MVPEDENTPQQESDPEDQKVAVDDQEVSESSVKSNQKVELDLDDAPFLEWDEDEEEEESAEEKKEVAESGEEEAEDKERKESLLVRIKRRWWMFAAAAALLMVSAVVAILFVTLQEEEQKKLPQVVEQEQSKESGKNKSEQGEQVSLQPFWVEYDAENDYQYFHLGIDLNVNGSKPAWELEKKGPVIRDALYYFLKNKDIEELSDKNSIKDLKKEILTIVNNNLSNGKANQVLIQKYLVE